MKSFIALVAAVAAALLVSSCSSPTPDGHTDHEHGSESSAAAQIAESAAKNNGADVMFGTGMIPHHQQALLVQWNSGNEDGHVGHDGARFDAKVLAKQIVATQQAEIDQMAKIGPNNGG